MDKVIIIGGKKYGIKENSCYNCANCSDIFYDDLGPYATCCEIECTPKDGICDNFEEKEIDG